MANQNDFALMLEVDRNPITDDRLHLTQTPFGFAGQFDYGADFKPVDHSLTLTLHAGDDQTYES